MQTSDLESREILTVSALNAEAREILEAHFGNVWVEGEVSNLARPRSGHVYFSLKDEDAAVRCAMFRSRARLLDFELEEGMQVLVAARVGLYEARGDYQLIVEHAEPGGAGVLRMRFEKLKRELAARGLFSADEKFELPAFPRRVGIVTSPTGAALRDILNVLRRRNPALEIVIYPAAVQGAAAAGEICSALKIANERDECDVLIVARGGGSLEDLWPFNEESVAYAIYESLIPVISGVGHEVDFTIADMVADVRAPTPSASAELCAPHRDELLQQLAQSRRILLNALQHRLAQHQDTLTHLSARLVHPGRRIEQHFQRLDELAERLPQAVRSVLGMQRAQVDTLSARLKGVRPALQISDARASINTLSQRLNAASRAHLEKQRHRLAQMQRTLEAIGPGATLSRGYSIVKNEDGRLVTDAAKLSPGDSIRAQFARGSATAKVESTED